MSTYKARFIAQASVEFEVELDADNQNDGLVLAHDLMLQVPLEAARIVDIHRATATIEVFECVKVETLTVPPGPLDEVAGFKLKAFAGRDGSGAVLFTTTAPNIGLSKVLANGLTTDEYFMAGSVEVQEHLGAKVYQVNAKRGGWELHMRHKDADLAKNVLIETWLEDKGAASRKAAGLLSQYSQEVISIFDFTNRSAGPIFWKQIG